MTLRTSTLLSGQDFTEYYRYGVTLKSRALKRWIKRKGYTQRFVAAQLGMHKQKLVRKLYRKQRFSQKEITALVRLTGAGTAIQVIWFPSLKEKRRVQEYVWEVEMHNTYNPDYPYPVETPAVRKRRAIAEQESEYGENWEQSEDFENFIFAADELPSRRFMRRHNDVRR